MEKTVVLCFHVVFCAKCVHNFQEIP
uniref:Uncharacterized protein n=1 Tax=Rhizophora mucronata TaxID=61149 RepID=A0A2P2R106_RHIMU